MCLGGGWKPTAMKRSRSEICRFGPEIVQAIEGRVPGRVPGPRSERQRRLLLKILCAWDREELREHLSPEPAAVLNTRLRHLKNIKATATALSSSLASLDQSGRSLILMQMLEKRMDGIVRREDFATESKRLDEAYRTIQALQDTSPEQLRRPGRGQPRNIAAYLVLQDAAEIYEWWTGLQATREVNRDDGTESGPFFRFVSVLWPAIFGSGMSGSKSAMKTWASYRSKFGERSALIANMNVRFPAWRLFEL